MTANTVEPLAGAIAGLLCGTNAAPGEPWDGYTFDEPLIRLKHSSAGYGEYARAEPSNGKAVIVLDHFRMTDAGVFDCGVTIGTTTTIRATAKRGTPVKWDPSATRSGEPLQWDSLDHLLAIVKREGNADHTLYNHYLHRRINPARIERITVARAGLMAPAPDSDQAETA